MNNTDELINILEGLEKYYLRESENELITVLQGFEKYYLNESIDKLKNVEKYKLKRKK